MNSEYDQHPHRREFIMMASAGFGSVTLWPQCLSADLGDREPVSFDIVTDTHVGYRDKANAAQQWNKTVAELRQSEGSFVIHLGDVVDGGRESQYPIYLAAREQLNKPVYEIPGNHDPDELFQRHIRKSIDTVVDHKWLRLILMNNSRRDSHDGFVSESQIAWIDDQLTDASRSGMLAALCLHVPVHKNRHPDRGWYVKPENGQTKLYETISRHKQTVLAMFHGHFHNGIRGWDDHSSIHEICFPSALYNLNRALEERKAPGYNPLEFRPGFTQIKIDGKAMTLRYTVVGSGVALEKPLNLSEASKR